MTETELDLEADSRKHCIVNVRHNDMGEEATNKLMEQINDDDFFVPSSDPDGEPFEIKHFGTKYETRIGQVQVSEILSARLQALFIQHNPFTILSQVYLDQMYRRIFLLIYRYMYIDPGFLRQGFLAPKYFRGISDAFGRNVDLESFSSALNTTIPNYCSLFPDVESHFGSQGSFFDLDELGENYLVQVSPPRIGKITVQAVEHSIKLIRKTSLDPKRPAYYLVLLTPAIWHDVNRLLDKCEFLIWKKNPAKGLKIGYLDVTTNKPTLFPMPRVSVLSNTSDTFFSEKLSVLFS